jgi:TolA-binding protein
MERGETGSAEEMFRQNLTGPLRPDSAEWRESLFTMGYLAFLVGNRLDAAARTLELGGESKHADMMRKLEQSVAQFALAAAKLDEALQRYPEDSAALHSKYVLAESLRHTTKLPRARLVHVTIEATRTALTKQIQEAADAALAHYAELVDELNRRQENAALSPLEKAMLRNAYFAQAGAYYDLNQYEQAIAAYKAAANRYQNQPEALDAYFQLAACYRRLNRSQDARGTLEQAKVVLARMNVAETAFVKTTRHTKQEWERLLDWLIGL